MRIITENHDMLSLYILMRNDMESLTGSNFNRVGKAVAQGSHASNQMVVEALNKNDPNLNELLSKWSSEANGFGTCIVLSVTEAQMRASVCYAQALGFHAGITHDPTYPLLDGETLHLIPVDTCAYIFGYKHELRLIIGDFDLMP